MTHTGERVFGVVLAGGGSRRFGRPKALAPMAGAPMASWSVAALQAAALPVGVVSSVPEIGSALGVPVRSDIEPGRGPLGGLWTALEWAQERGDDGVFLLGCDMPLIGEALIRLVLGRPGDAPAVAPMGSQGPEPMCALYRAACGPTVRDGLRSPDPSLHALLNAVHADVVDRDTVASVTDPEVAFWNVNTEADGVRAGELLAAAGRSLP